MAKANQRRKSGRGNDYERMGEYAQALEIFGEVKPAPDPVQTGRTARRIAYFLVAIMVFTVVGHYVLTLVLGLLGGEEQTIEMISAIFRSWFPVITGFAGGAITYFLTHSR